MRTEFSWTRPLGDVLQDFTGPAVQLFVANEAKRLMDPYVPALDLTLARNVRVYVENGGGIVHYQSPHARYQYYGKVMVSKRPGVRKSSKVVKRPEQALNYTTFRHPLATSKWDQAMRTARGTDLARAVQNHVGGN